MSESLTLESLTEVLQQMHADLGDFDPDQRALVGVRVVGEDEVEVVDLELDDHGVVHAEHDVAAILLVTGDTIELAETGEVTPIRQIVGVLRSGEEAGVFRLGDDDELYAWSTDRDDASADLRPRTVEANLARRALGVRSYVDDVHITEFLARLYLLHLAQVTLERFDAGEEPVAAEDVDTSGEHGPFALLLSDDAYPDDEAEAARQLADELTWEHVRRLAVRGDLHVGPYAFDPEHADFLDARGFAQHFDTEVMPAEELLGALETMGDDDLVGWAVGQLLDRDWYAPTVAIAHGDLAAAAQLASTDPRYGD